MTWNYDMEAAPDGIALLLCFECESEDGVELDFIVGFKGVGGWYKWHGRCGKFRQRPSCWMQFDLPIDPAPLPEGHAKQERE